MKTRNTKWYPKVGEVCFSCDDGKWGRARKAVINQVRGCFVLATITLGEDPKPTKYWFCREREMPSRFFTYVKHGLGGYYSLEPMYVLENNPYCKCIIDRINNS